MFKYHLLLLLLLFTTYVHSKPYTKTHFKLDKSKHTMIQVENKDVYALRCYVAIDGYKIYFDLKPKASSIWYRATDPRFNYTHFSTKCVESRYL